MAVSIEKFRLFRKRTSRSNTNDLSNEREINEDRTILPLPFSIENNKGKTMDIAKACKSTGYMNRGI